MKIMKKFIFQFQFTRGRAAGQGLVEYAILIAIVSTITIFGLTLLGGSVQGGFIRVCATLGNDHCQDVQDEVIIVKTPTPIPQVSVTPSLIPTATPTLAEPDPTRQPPILTMVVVLPTSTIAAETNTMRIKVVLNGKDDEKKKQQGILVVIYNTSNEYITEGVTDSKGNVSFSVKSGEYIVATFYDKVWQKDGPFKVTNSREYIIHRKNKD